MRASILFAAASIGLASAIALPQTMGIDLASANAVAQPTELGAPATGQSEVPTYNTASAASTAAAEATADPIADKRRRDAEAAEIIARDADCAPQPTGAAVRTTPDTDVAFLGNTNYTKLSLNAVTPAGYSMVFQNLTGSTQQGGYMGYYTMNAYSTSQCQSYCDQAQGCTAFNVYIERDPALNPATACPNPASTSNIKCVLYGLPISASTATNNGQWRASFHVVIVASNGYSKNPDPPAYNSFTGPTELGGAIMAPLYYGNDTYIGMRLFTGPYNPAQCASTCTATTRMNSKQQNVAADGTYQACNFFNAYILSKNYSPMGTYCSFYTRPWDRSFGTNYSVTDTDGSYYTVSSSYSYTLNPQDPGHI